MANVHTVFAAFLAALSLMVVPSFASAQRGPAAFTEPQLDLEEGVATVRVTGRATFRSISRAVRQRAWLDGISDAAFATEEDFVRANPGRIIHLCRVGNGEVRMARDPSVFYDLCDPGRRDRWLVSGMRYRVPLFRAVEPAVSDASALQAVAEERRRREMAEADRDRMHGERDRLQAELAALETSSDTEAGVSEESSAASARARSPDARRWGELMAAFLAALGCMFILFAFVRRGMQKRFERDAAAMRHFAQQNANVKNALLERKIQSLESDAARLTKSSEDLRKAHDAEQRQKNVLLEMFNRMCQAFGAPPLQQPISLSKVEVKAAAWVRSFYEKDTQLTQTRDALAVREAEHQAMARREQEHRARIDQLEAENAVLRERVNEQRERKERIPKLLSRLEELKTRRKRLALMHQAVLNERADVSDEQAYVFEGLASEYASGFTTEEERQLRETREELRRLINEATGYYDDELAVEDPLLEMQLQAEDARLQAEAEREALRELRRRFSLPSEQAIPERLESLEEAFSRMSAEFADLKKSYQDELRKRIDAESEISALRHKYGGQRSPWDVDQKEMSWTPPAERPRRITTNFKVGGESDTKDAAIPRRSPSRSTMLAFARALTLLVDEIEPLNTDGEVLLPLDRATAADFARLLARVHVPYHDETEKEEFVPARILAPYAVELNGGRLPERVRNKTQPPPATH